MFVITYVFFLGRERELAFAELLAALGIVGQPPATLVGSVAVLESEKVLPDNFIDRLGGTDRVAQQVARFAQVPSPAEILDALSPLAKRWKIGLSALLPTNIDLKALAVELKQQARTQGSRLSFVTPIGKRPQLNAAQVIFNKLDQKPNVELTLWEYEGNVVLLKTLEVQDIVAYEKRDTARPARDPKSGMLPPKLAQMMINIALGNVNNRASDGDRIGILDPFCGSGTVLQEGWLMDCHMTGTDASERAVRACQRNLDWLAEHFHMNELITPDVTVHDVSDPFPKGWKNSFAAVVTEPYLGPPVKAPLSPAVAQERLESLAALYRAAFKHIFPALQTGGVIAFLFPVFFTKDGWRGLPQNVIDGLAKNGYRVVQLSDTARGLTYKRPDALVARELIVFKKL